jgi:hypothetical protein
VGTPSHGAEARYPGRPQQPGGNLGEVRVKQARRQVAATAGLIPSV